MPSPHVTQAVVSTAAAGTAQPLTCGRPRQTGRRSAVSGIRGCQQDSSGQVRRPKPSRISTELEVLPVSPSRGGRCQPSLRHWLANGALLLTDVCDAPGRGRCGGIPRRRGCAGDFSAGQGEGVPPTQCRAASLHFPWLRPRDRMTGASWPLLLGAAHVCDAAVVVAGKSAWATIGQTSCM